MHARPRILIPTAMLLFLSGCEVHPVGHYRPVYEPAPAAPPAPEYVPTSVVDGCAYVDEVGACDGQTLRFCQDGQTYSYYCPEYGRECAWDSAYDWFECLPPGYGSPSPSPAPTPEPTPTPDPTPIDECGGVTAEGVCDGERLSYCAEDGTLATIDCAADGLICTYDGSQGYYDCLTPEVPADECGGISYEGSCDGDTVLWCDEGTLQSEACEVCGWDDANGYYGCLAAEEGCGDVSYEGTCDGNTVLWCEGEALQSQDCDGTCGWDDANGYYGCI